MFTRLKQIASCVAHRMTCTHVPSHRPLEGNARLHVAAVYFNHRHFNSLLTNFQRFQAHMEDLGVTLHIVEVVLNDAEFEVTDPHNDHHVQLRTQYELFHKENLVNIAFANAIKLYGPDCKYLAWIDADLHFMAPNIVQDTIDELQRHPVVQMWSRAIDLDPDGHPIKFPGTGDTVVHSFAWCYKNLGIYNKPKLGYATLWHPGYAYAIRRDTFEAMEGLFDISILGAGDHHMAWAFVGHVHKGIHGQASEVYKKKAREHLFKIKHEVNGDLGCVDGTIIHYWHGTKGSRRYVERWSILVDNKFDPDQDLVRRADGLLELTGNNLGLRDGIRKYFELRNDDCNVTEEFFKKKL